MNNHALLSYRTSHRLVLVSFNDYPIFLKDSTTDIENKKNKQDDTLQPLKNAQLNIVLNVMKPT